MIDFRRIHKTKRMWGGASIGFNNFATLRWSPDHWHGMLDRNDWALEDLTLQFSVLGTQEQDFRFAHIHEGGYQVMGFYTKDEEWLTLDRLVNCDNSLGYLNWVCTNFLERPPARY